MLQSYYSSRLVGHTFLFIVKGCLEVCAIVANILTFLTLHILNIIQMYTEATKHGLHSNFTYVHEKVILPGRSRLRALVLVFAHDMKHFQVAHAMCKQGCRLISDTAN